MMGKELKREANGDVVAAIDHSTARNNVILPKNRA